MHNRTDLRDVTLSGTIGPLSAPTGSLCSSCSNLPIEATIRKVLAQGKRRDLSNAKRGLPQVILDVTIRYPAGCDFCHFIQET
jgi:hypothetical protein